MDKICNDCKLDKDFCDFNTKPGRNGTRRYNYICKVCQSKRNKIRNASIRERFKPDISKKKCNQCLLVLEASEFTIDNYQKSGLSKLCKSCQNNYYNDNRDRIQETNKKSQVKNKDKNNERKRKWAKENNDKVVEANSNYYKKNKDKISAANKKWAKENPLAVRAKGHKYRATI